MLFYNFILKVLIVINGLGAASGLVVDKHHVYAVADDDAHLYIYHKKKNEVKKVDLQPEVKEKGINKKDKPDFETISRFGDELYILGSGSKENRFDFITYNTVTKEVRNSNYKFLLNDFGVNGIFKVLGNVNDLQNKTIEFYPIQLPELNGEQTTFSDAILIDGKVLFTATVESKSTTQYNGEIKGSIIGELDLDYMRVTRWEKISDDRKIEGLALYKQSQKKYTLYLCEDNDDDSKKANIFIYKYELNNKNTNQELKSIY